MGKYMKHSRNKGETNCLWALGLTWLITIKDLGWEEMGSVSAEGAKKISKKTCVSRMLWEQSSDGPNEDKKKRRWLG